MITPAPFFSICGMAYLAPRNGPFKHTANVRSHSSSVVSRMARGTVENALLCKMSSRPNCRIVASIAASTWLASDTSVWTNRPRPPICSIRATVSRPPSSEMSATVTAAPSLANSRAVARPMPEPAPVISATLPDSFTVLRLPQSVSFYISTNALSIES